MKNGSLLWELNKTLYVEHVSLSAEKTVVFIIEEKKQKKWFLDILRQAENNLLILFHKFYVVVMKSRNITATNVLL